MKTSRDGNQTLLAANSGYAGLDESGVGRVTPTALADDFGWRRSLGMDVFKAYVA